MLPAERVRVGYVVKRFPRYSETFVVGEILAHEAAGWEIEIFALRPPNDTHFQDGIARIRAPVRYLPSEGLRAADLWGALDQASVALPGLWEKLGSARGEDARDVYQAVLLAREIRIKGIEHLHAHFASLATTVARLAAGFADVPYTFTAHAKDIFHQTVQPVDLGRKFRDAAAVITVSDFNLDYIRRTYGALAAQGQRIYNGLDLQQFAFTSPDVRPPTIVAVGRLVEKKGFAELVEACALLAARDRPFNCVIVGTGELELDLRARIDRLGLRPRVHLLGPLPQGEVCTTVRRAAVFAAPCVIGPDGNRDGLPTTILEAMALGTPCVSTPVTGIPEIVRHGETGLLVPERDTRALAAALERLLEDSELRVALAERARRLVESQFDVRVNTARLRDLFVAARAQHSPLAQRAS